MTGMAELADLGLEPVVEDTLTAAHAQRLARTLDHDDDILASGELPLTWIWIYFTPTAPTSSLRDDGHPRAAGSGVLAGLDRRMFVGGSLDRRGPIRLDTVTERTSTITDTDHKHGSTGAFVIVTVEHAYRQNGEVVLVEQQRVLYRAAPASPVPAPGPPTDPRSTGPGLRRAVQPDERLLFRYSALTFNTHRIHYDHAYATKVEGYPGLVVHGPLTATLLADLASQHLERPLSSFSFRATAPSFAGHTISLYAEPPDEPTPGEAVVRAVREDDVTIMTGTAHTST